MNEEPDDKKMFQAGGKFNLGEAMMNKKHLSKARDDVKKLKTIVSEM